MNQRMQTFSRISQFYSHLKVHKYVKMSWTSERLGVQSALALLILESGNESRNDTNSVMVLAVLIKYSSGVDVSW